MRFLGVIYITILVCSAMSACWESGRSSGPDDGTSNTDTDSDSDTDADADSDSDTDTDTETIYSGQLVWAKRAGGWGMDSGRCISALSDGSSLVTGYFGYDIIDGQATFGPGEPNETVLILHNNGDAFLAKYNPDGTLAWVKYPWEEGGAGRIYSIFALYGGSFVMTGAFSNTVIFGPGEPNETALVSDGYSDIFVAKYNTNGTLAWAKRAGGTVFGGDGGFGISAISDGTALVTGNFAGTATFGPEETGETVLDSEGEEDIFVAKYNADGTLAWAKRAGGSEWDYGRSISALSDGATVVTGHFKETATFAPGETNETVLSSAGSTDIFVAKYNIDGTLAWAKRAGGNGPDYGRGISASAGGSALVTGFFQGTATFGLGEIGETVLTSAVDDDKDIFVAKYNADGTLAWAKRAGGNRQDRGMSISALTDGSAIVTGCFRSTATFGAGEINETVFNTDEIWWESEIFVAKYNADGTLTWVKRAGGAHWDEGHGISALPDGSALVTGHFHSTATFGLGETNETVLDSEGDPDIFVAKFDP